MDKILHHSVRLCCDAVEAFKMFTNNKHLQSWLCVLANVEPIVGGKYELFWNPEDKENDSTHGCKITAIEPGKFLSFEWRGPKQYKHFMNNADPLTHVVVFFIPQAQENTRVSCTEVHVIHSGWRNSQEWESARQWFERVWSMVLEELKKHVNGQ